MGQRGRPAGRRKFGAPSAGASGARSTDGGHPGKNTVPGRPPKQLPTASAAARPRSASRLLPQDVVDNVPAQGTVSRTESAAAQRVAKVVLLRRELVWETCLE